MTAYQDRDEREDEDEDWADDQEDYGDDSDDEPTVPCPYCRRDILEDSPRCPYFERFLRGRPCQPEEAPLGHRDSHDLPRCRNLVGACGTLRTLVTDR